MIKTENVAFSYSKTEGSPLVLDDVNLVIHKGEFVSILGHNGSGKSTLAKLFNAILLPCGGKVYVEKMDTSDEANLLSLRKSVGMVFQNPDNQLVANIVEEDVAFAPENLGVEPGEIRKRVDEALDTVHMSEYKDKAPNQLSGGQKQRIAIAGMIAMRPKYLVLDEPTAMLDPRGRRMVMRTIKKLNKEYGVTVVLITHYMDEAAQSERVIVIDGGRLKMDGTPKSVFSNVELMKDMGLDVPQVTELSYLINKGGVEFPRDILSAEEFIEAIKKKMEA